MCSSDLPDYFAVLTRHGVTHIYNAWENMPPLSEQLALVGSETNPARLTARLLLREERSYTQAVQRFSPYAAVQEPNAAGRAAAVALVRRGLANKAKVMLFANNRFEGHSPGTLQAIVEQLEDAGG